METVYEIAKKYIYTKYTKPSKNQVDNLRNKLKNNFDQISNLLNVRSLSVGMEHENTDEKQIEVTEQTKTENAVVENIEITEESQTENAVETQIEATEETLAEHKVEKILKPPKKLKVKMQLKHRLKPLKKLKMKLKKRFTEKLKKCQKLLRLQLKKARCMIH